MEARYNELVKKSCKELGLAPCMFKSWGELSEADKAAFMPQEEEEEEEQTGPNPLNANAIARIVNANIYREVVFTHVLKCGEIYSHMVYSGYGKEVVKAITSFENIESLANITNVVKVVVYRTMGHVERRIDIDPNTRRWTTQYLPADEYFQIPD